MAVLIHSHALKHGLEEKQILAAYASAVDTGVIRSRDKDSDPQRYATIGFDREGRFIELVFVKQAHNQVLIFHANYLTAGFRKEHRNGIRSI